jgi:ATP-dependent Clp protease ATP-binding subunit ClpX
MTTSNIHPQECSFCGKHRTVVKKLIVGEDSAICNDCVDLCFDLLKEEVENSPQDSTEPKLYPDDIKNFLDSYVIGQDLAKKILSVAVTNHYKRINNKNDNISIQKANVLILGPTGSGKTLLAKTIARYLDVPFVVADATSLTEAGYVGDDVESMIARLLAAADGDVEKAQRGIVFVDEIDKIARKSESQSITRDVSGEGVQQALLKLVEGTVCRIPQSGRRKNPNMDVIEIDTTNILFIAGGAFVGLEDIIAKRIDGNSIGFGAKLAQKSQIDYLEQLTPDDLTKFGMIPEFTGRFTSRVNVSELTKEQLIEILTNVKNSYIKQYVYLLELDKIQLSFDQQAIEQIAENCVEMTTGARGLHSEIERVLLPHMYAVQQYNNNDIREINITKDLVDNPRSLLEENQDNEGNKHKG